MPYARRRIAEMAGKLAPAEIATVLNAEGLTTKYDGLCGSPDRPGSRSLVPHRPAER